MGEYYETAYKKRLNRYGLDYQSRIQKQRERDFENYLYKTIYRVDFEFNGESVPASLERYKQDYSETQGYLLTRTSVSIPNGTVLMVQSQNGTETPWMVWWLEQIEASGYNRYVVLKMTHRLQLGVEENAPIQWVYFSGPGTAAISDTIKTATGRAVYSENNNLYTFITPYNALIARDLYFEVGSDDATQGYVVVEFDIHSTPGISYVSVDPVPVRDKASAPTQASSDNNEDFFWLQGGKQ